MVLDDQTSRLIVVTGPARSGKSEWAEALALQSGRSVLYIATALVQSSDREWQARIEAHLVRRPPTWETWEVPVELATAIARAAPTACILVDALGTWLANCLDETDLIWQHRVDGLLASLQITSCQVILVAEETGWGVVPAYPLGRRFRDRMGTLTRQVGAIADAVYLVTAGYALNLKTLGTPLPPIIDP
ncbi:bifunctional adenosylcobinamide kinase/adenosylcobinamide-phosphate guanylyltransferase [Synechococcales cyanobacterium C]|uniref:Adenosylcobinamide kinase n=1 Tax=Petrachloros mirabilis ULC683 TaxID=2781853 RepID=A0A8K2ANC4_9CYAN|nr:bifunctional adenosylcobinamide kinase/adenosylcobinamide-phosphate guanylyltransferase [Petrachloros mirabilis]NCJ05388.1 bifunctional adenosylcobinamide kinase/adenosylcobinamide-phosphate guanylyltransferase [Petrachloros mirabilis ULC683]